MKARLLKFLRVPPEPDPPAGSPNSLRIFRAGPGYFKKRVFAFVFKQIGTFTTLIVGLLFLSTWLERFHFLGGLFQELSLPTSDSSDAPSKVSYFAAIEIMAIVGAILQLPVAWLLVRLDFEMRWYMVTDRSLRIREGIVLVREQTLSFSNIQEIQIQQGPIDRFFGIADLHVSTAGGGAAQSGDETSGHSGWHVGILKGVVNAAEIRDLILVHQRGLITSGLGDPDEPVEWEQESERSEIPPTGKDPGNADLESAARELLEESRAFRLWLTSRDG
jgi:hypothetical protein